MVDGTACDRTIRAGDEVLSCYGSGDFRPARVTHARVPSEPAGLDHASSGRRITSTPDHVHFAGFVLGRTPQQHMTYVMWREDKGFRVGTSHIYKRSGQGRPWTNAACARRARGCPLGRVDSRDGCRGTSAGGDPRRHLRPANAAVRCPHSQGHIERRCGREPGSSWTGLFAELDTEKGGLRLRTRAPLRSSAPLPRHDDYIDGRARSLDRRALRRSARLSPMHRISLFGYDDEGREALEAAGFSVRPARKGSDGWRYETCTADMGMLAEIVGRSRSCCLSRCGVWRALLTTGDGVTNSLPFMPASSVRPGMVMVDERGEFDVVTTVETVERRPSTTSTSSAPTTSSPRASSPTTRSTSSAGRTTGT